MSSWIGHILIVPDDIPVKACEAARAKAEQLYPALVALHGDLQEDPDLGMYVAGRDSLKRRYPQLDVERFIDGGETLPMKPQDMLEVLLSFKSYAVGYRAYPADESKWIVCVGSDSGDPPSSEVYAAVEAAITYGVLELLGIE